MHRTWICCRYTVSFFRGPQVRNRWRELAQDQRMAATQLAFQQFTEGEYAVQTEMLLADVGRVAMGVGTCARCRTDV